MVDRHRAGSGASESAPQSDDVAIHGLSTGGAIVTTKQFHLAHILSITTGILLPAPDVEYPMETVYEILNFMTKDNLYTHQLPRAAKEVRPYLLEQFPWAKEIDASNIGSGEWDTWLAQQVEKYGAWHMVAPMHLEDHENIDPIDEIRRMRPDLPVITIETASESEPSPYGDIDWKDDGEE